MTVALPVPLTVALPVPLIVALAVALAVALLLLLLLVRREAQLIEHPAGDGEGIGAALRLGDPASGFLPDGEKGSRHRGLHARMGPCKHCEAVGVLLWVGPVGHLPEGISGHPVDQFRQHPPDVAEQAGLDSLGLDPCVLHCVMQRVHVLPPVMGAEVGIAPVQQLMHDKPDPAGELPAGDLGIVGNVREDQIPVLVYGGGHGARLPMHPDGWQAQGRAGDMGESLQAVASLIAQDARAPEQGFDGVDHSAPLMASGLMVAV